MSNVTSIEWTDRSSNPIRARNVETGKVGHFCVHVSGGCKNCYAGRLNVWRGNGLDFIAPNLKRVEFLLDDRQIEGWRRLKPGTRVFVCDMTDLFLEAHPDAMIDAVFRGFLLAPQVTFQVLTKRATRMREYFAARSQGICFGGDVTLNPLWQPWPLPNVHLGVSAEDQETSDDRIPHLLSTPAAVRFISAEPLLGPVDLAAPAFRVWEAASGMALDPRLWSMANGGRVLNGIDWVIGGGESGPGARPCHPEWARELRNQCRAAGVAFFWKQWGEFLPAELTFDQRWKGQDGEFRTDWPPLRLHDSDPHTPCGVYRVGKKRAGRLLDGRTWDEFPDEAQGANLDAARRVGE